MDSSWDDLHLFLTVAETGSLSQAARKLRIAQPTVSRRLAQLEEQLGYSLCDRGTDGIRLSPLGEQLLEPLRHMAKCAALCEIQIEQREQDPRGVVRITAPPGIAYDFLVPFAAELKLKNPSIQLQVLARVQYLDLARREADLAIRMRPTEQKELTSLFQMDAPVGAFASAEYVARLPKDWQLSDVDFVGWAPPFEELAPNPQLSAAIKDFVPAFGSDDYLVQCRAAELGLGVIFLPLVRHRFAFDRGLTRLAKLDPGSEVSGHVQLLGSKSALAVNKVRFVADLLVNELEQITPADSRL